MDPINYTLNVKTPFEQSLAGVQSGFNIGEAALKSDMLRQAQQQAQVKQQEQLQMQRDLSGLANNPRAGVGDYNRVMTLYPQLAEHFKGIVASKTETQKQADLSKAAQVYSALHNGQPEIAAKVLAEQQTAAMNSGNTQAAHGAEALKMIVESNPAAAKTTAAMFLLALPGGDKVIEGATKLGAEARAEALAPSQLSESQAKAQKAAVDSRFAESQAIADLTKKGWDITKIQEDIKIAKLNNQIAAAHVAVAKEGNTIKREELQQKATELKQKRDETVRTQAADVENARSSIDNLLNTADRIVSTPRSVIEAAAGPVSSRIPTTSKDTADFEALIENLDAQAFIAQIPAMKGMGALSDAEGRKLGASLQNFSLKQSPERLIENVQEAQRLMLKARKTLAARYGVPESVPNTPAAAASPATDIDALIRKYAK